jgi:hypothetical protein
MMRNCTRCKRPFSPEDLARDESKGMESERKQIGLKGVRFVYYHCPCGMSDIFVDILPRDGEYHEEFERRRSDMEAAVRQVHGDRAEAVVIAVEKR